MTNWLDELDRLEKEKTIATFQQYEDLLHEHARELIDAARKDKRCDDVLRETVDRVRIKKLRIKNEKLLTLLRRVDVVLRCIESSQYENGDRFFNSETSAGLAYNLRAELAAAFGEK